MARKTKPKTGRKPPSSGRKPGAQKGNKNAEKHGFYSTQFTAEQNKRLATSDRTDLQSEIDLLRVCLDRLYKQIDMDPVYQQGKDADGLIIATNQRDDHYLRQLNTLSIMTQSLSTSIRTQYLTKGKGGQIELTIMEALEELRLEMGI